MAKVLTKRRLGLFVLFLLITAGLTMPATADKKTRVKKTRVPTEQVPGLLIGQWKGTYGLMIPQISLDITSVQDGKIRGDGREFGGKCTGPYEIRGKITKKGSIIYTRIPTECPEGWKILMPSGTVWVRFRSEPKLIPILSKNACLNSAVSASQSCGVQNK